MKKIGIYIHIPFCKTICTYCAFLTFAHKNKWIPDYVEALLKEIKEKSLKYKDYLVDTIYFGGGTPSLIDSIYIERILSSIKGNFQQKANLEISLEANPESLTSEKIFHYKQIGINRISLGVQSLNAKTLLKVARPHNEKAIFTALENLKNANWENFGCDIIMGLPYQTLAEFKSQLKTLLSYQPTHLSSYFLSYDTKKIDLFIKDCPQEEEQIKMYNYLIKTLAKERFDHYEVSNYAKPGFKSEHNQRYWNRDEYLGLGIGAHSFIDETVSENIRDFDKYLENPLLLEESYKLDKETQRMDSIMLSLRTSKGINLNTYQKKYGNEKLNQLLKKAETYLQSNQLTQNKKNLILTDQGFLFADKIYKDLL